MAQTRQAKLAFIGCGGFATGAILPNTHVVPEIDLVAVCDLDRSKAEFAGRNFGARQVYTDMHEMLDKEELDGVFVIGPAPQQYELAPHVLKRGIPVYVEKPSANTSADARELAELAEANNTWGQVGFMKRFAYVYAMAREIMAKPDFGPLRLLSCKFAQGPYPQIWGMDSAKRAFLIGQCCHIFDLVRFFGGDVKTVQSLYHEATATQFGYMANVEFVSGAIGQININALANKQGFRDITEVLELVGLESQIICDDKLHLKWQPREDFVQSTPDVGRYEHRFDASWTSMRSAAMFGYVGEVAHFAKRCLGLVEDGLDLWDSVKSLQIGEAIYDSAHGAGVVTLGS